MRGGLGGAGRPAKLRPALGKPEEEELGRAGLSWSGLGDLARAAGFLPRCRPVSPQVRECLNQFKLTEAQLRQIQARILGSMELALRGEASPVPAVRMLPAYVGSIPHGTGG